MSINSRDLSRDIASLSAACVLHGAIFLSNPSVQWGAAQDDASDIIPVEFVQAPPPSPLLAPVLPSGDGTEGLPAHGPGDFQAEQAKAGSPDATKAENSAENKAREERRRTLAREALRRAERLTRLEQEAKNKRRQRMLAMAALSDQARSELAKRRAAELEAQRARKAELQAQRRRRRIELTRQLASMPNPDEELYDAPNALPAAPKGKDDGAPAKPSAQAPAPADLADPVFDPEGKEGSSAENVKPAGGGPASDAGGVGWSLEGPIGNRRLLNRKLPACPDWVSERDLDLTVQIKFQVLEDGTIRRGRVIKRTSGFPDIDRRAMEALGEWKFEPVPGGGKAAPETWGIVTFKFTAG